MIVPNWLIIAFGVLSVVSGIRAIRNRYVNTDVAEFEGSSAERWGYFWIMLGILFIVAAVFDIRWMKAAINFFFSA